MLLMFMLVSFFEEFPDKASLSRLRFVSWPTKLYVAARSLDDFNKIKKSIKNRNVKDIIYWPVLDKKEGYWISPFSRRSALKRVFNELKNSDVPIMIDAELPTTRNPLLYLTQSLNFFRNKRLIRGFIQNHKDVYACEYYPDGSFKDNLLSVFGLHYDSSECNNKVIKMVYHSMHDFDERFIVDELKRGISECGKCFLVGYGTIARGVAGNEPILSTLQLKKDLSIAKKVGVKEVIIYRLGGLDKNYSSLIKRFL